MPFVKAAWKTDAQFAHNAGRPDESEKKIQQITFSTEFSLCTDVRYSVLNDDNKGDKYS